MIRVTTFAGRRVAVFGLGRSGLATAEALKAGGAIADCWDDSGTGRQAAQQAGFTPSDLAAADWSSIAALVLTPGVPLTHPEPHWVVRKAQAAGVEIIGDVELFFRQRAVSCPQSPVVAITGTNGKSTTTALVSHLLRAAGRNVQMGGNIGTAILSLDPPAPDRIHVLELSSFQIDLTPSLAPTVGVLLNVSADHLDRHGTLERYAAIKQRLIATADASLVGIDDEISRAFAAQRQASAGTHWPLSNESRPQGYFVDGTKVSFADGSPRGAHVIADLAGITTLRGRHNAQNAAAAVGAASLLGVPADTTARAMRTFPGLPHRLEEIGRAGRTLFINDSKATNADSTEKALASFDGDIFWILGGLAKEGGIAPLARYFPRVAKAYLIGEAADAFAATLSGKVPFARCGTLDRAVAAAAADAAASCAREPVVLLSPACASYDQFKGFDQRGDAFRDLVATLPGIAVTARARP